MTNEQLLEKLREKAERYREEQQIRQKRALAALFVTERKEFYEIMGRSLSKKHW